MGQTQSLPPTSETASIPISLAKSASTSTPTKPNRPSKKSQPYATSFFEAQMLDTDTNVRRVNKMAPNYFETASVTPQPTRKPGSTYNVSISSSASVSGKTTSSGESIKKTYSDQRSLSLNTSLDDSTILTAKDGEGLSRMPSTIQSDTSCFTINDRRYWKENSDNSSNISNSVNSNDRVEFMLPCDDDESDRLMSLHYILKSVIGGNFISPVKHVLQNTNASINGGKRFKVLDIGCGSGTWVLEMATEFPNSDFYGLDQCPLFPVSIKPSNSYFQLHQVPNALPFEDATFDFVYMRMVVLHLHPDNAVSLLAEVSRILKPGGYFEVVDTDYIIRRPGIMSSTQINEKLTNLFYSPDFSSLSHETSSTHPLFTHIMLSSQMTGSSTLPFYGEFVEISQQQTSIPLGGDGERISEIYADNYQQFLTSVVERTRKVQLFDQYLSEIMKECRDYESYVDWFVCFARKPLREHQHHEKIPISNIEQSTLDSIYEFVDGFDDETSFTH